MFRGYGDSKRRFISSDYSNQFLDHSTRIQALGVWDTLIFLLNGLVFIPIGLELPFIIKELKSHSIIQAMGYGLLISLVIIFIRILYVFFIALLTRRLSKKIRSTEPNVGWRELIIVGWAGMRGVVSLATTLYVFLFIKCWREISAARSYTFYLLYSNSYNSGFSGTHASYSCKEKQDTMIHLKLIKSGLKYLQEKYSSEITRNPLIENLKNHLKNESFYINNQLNSSENSKEEIKLYQQVYTELISVQRQELRLFKKDFNDEVIRKKEMRLDLEKQKFHPNL